MKKAENASVRIIPLGGLEQIGMNITAIEYDDSIVVVDCGLSFPEEDMLGIDLVIPDVTYLKENLNKVKGFVITHGHEDHIGAIPYVLKDVNVPIYATKLTMGLIESKLKEHNMLRISCIISFLSSSILRMKNTSPTVCSNIQQHILYLCFHNDWKYHRISLNLLPEILAQIILNNILNLAPVSNVLIKTSVN